MELFFLRHAMEVDHGKIARDADRPLSEQGRRRMKRATEAWEGMGVIVDGIMTSPFLRATQTAEIAAETLGVSDRVETCAALAAGAAPEDIVAAVAERCHEDHRVLLVGHEPDLGRVISLLVCGDDGGAFRLKKGGLTKLIVDRLAPGRCAVLEWHLWPRHLVRMS